MTSERILHLLWLQAWQVTLLALAVALLVRWLGRKRAHLSHALWALVVLKCLMPPVVASPVGVFNLVQGTQDGAMVERSVHAEVVAAVETGTVHSPPESDLRAEVRASNDRARSLLNWLPAYEWFIGVWLCIGLFSLIFSSIRMGAFLRKIRREVKAPSLELRRVMEGLKVQLKMRRAVDLQVTDSGIGPAIVGLISPRILLPRSIVEHSSKAQLRALIAHELIHLRRGDLWWSLIQVFANSLLWFNPLVWIATRRLSCEAENCCDEETVASLGISPSAYARCLIAVLEQKHTLQAAPLLPGVRPIDVTAKRLERVMHFGQGSQRRCPFWVKFVLLVSAALVLPAIPMAVAQEQLQPPVSVAENAGKLTKRNTEGQNAKGDMLLQYTIRIVEMPYEQAADLFEDWDSVRFDHEVAYAGVADPEHPVQPASYAAEQTPVSTFTRSNLGEDQVQQILAKGTVLSCPTLLTRDGTEGALLVGGEVPYVGSYKRVKNDEGKEELKPQMEFRDVGINMTVNGKLMEDRKSVRLELRYQMTELCGTDKFTYESPQGPLTVDMPQFSTYRIQTSRVTPMQQTFAIGGGPYTKETKVEQGVPIIGSIPYIGRLFKNTGIGREQTATLIMVDCQAIPAEENGAPVLGGQPDAVPDNAEDRVILEQPDEKVYRLSNGDSR